MTRAIALLLGLSLLAGCASVAPRSVGNGCSSPPCGIQAPAGQVSPLPWYKRLGQGAFGALVIGATAYGSVHQGGLFR